MLNAKKADKKQFEHNGSKYKQVQTKTGMIVYVKKHKLSPI